MQSKKTKNHFNKIYLFFKYQSIIDIHDYYRDIFYIHDWDHRLHTHKQFDISLL